MKKDTTVLVAQAGITGIVLLLLAGLFLGSKAESKPEEAPGVQSFYGIKWDASQIPTWGPTYTFQANMEAMCVRLFTPEETLSWDVPPGSYLEIAGSTVAWTKPDGETTRISGTLVIEPNACAVPDIAESPLDMPKEDT